ERPAGAQRHPEARAAQCADPRHHARRARARDAALRRGAHRAGLHDPGIRQADRRRGVQSRLRGRPGRRAVHCDRVHRAEPPRRHRVRGRQPADTRALMATLADALPAPSAPSRAGPRAHPFRRLLRRGGAAVGLAIIAFFVVLAVLAPVISPYDPLATSWTAIRKAPSAAHWFGTDEIGRDVLARVIWGARASLLAGMVSVLISLSIGVPVGLLAGYAGGRIDMLISRLTDAVLACPFLILAIALAAFLGPSLTNAMIAIGVSATPVFVRLTRGQTMAIK